MASTHIFTIHQRIPASTAPALRPLCLRVARRRRIGMFTTKQHLTMVRTFGLALVAALGLAGCKTYDTEFATINSRLDQLDTKVQGAAQSAESANQSAQQANQRLDQLEGRVK